MTSQNFIRLISKSCLKTCSAFLDSFSGGTGLGGETFVTSSGDKSDCCNEAIDESEDRLLGRPESLRLNLSESRCTSSDSLLLTFFSAGTTSLSESDEISEELGSKSSSFSVSLDLEFN